jgi:hypothetical protein
MEQPWDKSINFALLLLRPFKLPHQDLSQFRSKRKIAPFTAKRLYWLQSQVARFKVNMMFLSRQNLGIESANQ